MYSKTGKSRLVADPILINKGFNPQISFADGMSHTEEEYFISFFLQKFKSSLCSSILNSKYSLCLP